MSKDVNVAANPPPLADAAADKADAGAAVGTVPTTEGNEGIPAPAADAALSASAKDLATASAGALLNAAVVVPVAAAAR